MYQQLVTPECEEMVSGLPSKPGTSATRWGKRRRKWAVREPPIALISPVRPQKNIVPWVSFLLQNIVPCNFFIDTVLLLVGQGIVAHRVTEEDNGLGVGTPFPGISPGALNDSDLYAVEKELFLGSKCEVRDSPQPWQFWMVMLKSGNLDTTAGLCPENGRPIGPFEQTPRFPCFGKGCMNQPSFYHEQTRFVDGRMKLRGSFNGSYELGADLGKDGDGSRSFYEVVWEKEAGAGSWVFSHRLKTSGKYPWLMLYLRADATAGFSGGYHYETRGMLKSVSRAIALLLLSISLSDR